MFTESDKEQRYLPDWVILGDNSRGIFLEWLFPGGKPGISEDSEVWIRYGMKPSIERGKSRQMIETPVLLPRTTLCFPPTDDSAFALDTSKRTRYAVLEEFPFRKQTSMDLIQRIKRETRDCEVLVILMDLPRHQGSTDMIDPGGDLEQAKEAYREEGFDVSVMQDASNLRCILHWHRPMYDVWKNKVRDHLEDMRERILEMQYDYPSLEEDWHDEGGLLQEKTLDRLFSYQMVEREKGNNLWERYAAVTKRALFPAFGQGPLAPVEKLYQECLDNPLVFWSVDEDVKELMGGLRTAFVKALEKEEAAGGYRKRTQLPESLDEDSYFRLVAKGGDDGTALNAVFSRRIRDYLCNDVKGYLQKRLEKRYQQLEDMIL